MTCTQLQPQFPYFDFSVKSSRIPRLLTNFVQQIPIEDNNKLNNNNNNNQFWHKFNSLNLNGNKSRIPIKKPRIKLTANSSPKDQISESETDSQNYESEVKRKLNADNSLDCDDFSGKVKLRSVRGRSGLTTKINGWTKSDPIDYLHLKDVLEIVRSNLSADNKFKAIKRYRDKRLGLISQMEKYSNDSNCDERVREWVDSGYMSNTNSITPQEDPFASSHSKSDAAVNTAVPLTHQPQVWPRTRSYTNPKAMDLIALNNRYNSFNSDISMSSISSIESLLESRREDPEELLLALGFGYVPDEQPLSRIPQRFLESPSFAKGVSSESLLKSCGLVNVSSLSSSTSFSPTDTLERSYSSGRISERFRKRLSSKELKIDLPEIITSAPSLLNLQSPQSDSILNPANRKFLEDQGKQDDQNQLSSKRLIIGTKSYKLDTDGDPLAFPKTPSPVATTPVPTDTEMDASESNDEQISSNTDDNSSQSSKRRLLHRQNCVSVEDLDFDMPNQNSSMTDLSSELSSSTATLVGTVTSVTNEKAANDKAMNLSDNLGDKRNAFSQTDNKLTEGCVNETVEAAFVVAIQSLRLSLEFYKHQSLKLAKLSAKKYKESSSDFTEEDVNRLSSIHQLRESIHRELVDMDTLLNKHLNVLKTSNGLEMSFVSQAQIFTEAVKKMTELLKEQQNIYSRLDLMKSNND